MWKVALDLIPEDSEGDGREHRLDTCCCHFARWHCHWQKDFTGTKQSLRWSQSQTPTALLMSFLEVGISTGNVIDLMNNLRVNSLSGSNLFPLGIEWTIKKFPLKQEPVHCSKKHSMRGAHHCEKTFYERDWWLVSGATWKTSPSNFLFVASHFRPCRTMWLAVSAHQNMGCFTPQSRRIILGKKYARFPLHPCCTDFMLAFGLVRFWIGYRQNFFPLSGWVFPHVYIGLLYWTRSNFPVTHRVLFGVVCNLPKAFNCLNRQVIHKLGTKGGIPTPILTAWAGSLQSLQRQVQIGGYLYGEQHSSTTGYPETRLVLRPSSF